MRRAMAWCPTCSRYSHLRRARRAIGPRCSIRDRPRRRARSRRCSTTAFGSTPSSSRNLTTSSACPSVTALSPCTRLTPVAAMIGVMLLLVGCFGSAPAASRRRMISMSAAALATRNGVAPIESVQPSRESRWPLGHLQIRIRATSQQRLHEPQLRLPLRNSTHRIGETEHRIGFAAFPCARRPNGAASSPLRWHSDPRPARGERARAAPELSPSRRARGCCRRKSLAS